MKLFVVIGGWSYEGYSAPVGVFSTLEAAKAAAASAQGYSGVDVLEYTLDEAQE